MARILFVFLVTLLFSTLRAQYPNVRINQVDSQPEEMTIAVNPVNPQNLVAGANIDRYYYSFDGGLSWADCTLVSAQFGVWGDPCVTFDAEGNAYFAHLSYPPQGSWLDRIVVQKSTDGGVTYNQGAGVGLNGQRDQDKEWLIADRTGSAYHNNLYMFWTEFDNYGSTTAGDSSRILFSRSTDGGVSWSKPLKISDREGDCVDDDLTVEGAVPAVGPQGQVYTSWSGPSGIMFDMSADGGQSFGTDIKVADQPGGWAFDIPGISRCNGMPVTLCDVSYASYRGRIYVVWSDQRNGTSDTDVFVAWSDDEGGTWSAPARVNNDLGGAQQFFHWAAIDASTGYLYVVFYDRRNSSGNQTEVALARSADGGATFNNYIISTSPFLPDASIFFGDYTNIAAHNGKVYPIWMRLDTWELSAWTALVEEPLLLDEYRPFVPGTSSLKQNFPNPFNSSTQIAYELAQNGFVQLDVFNLNGQKVRTLFAGIQNRGPHQINFEARGLPGGVYVYRLKQGGQEWSRKLLLVK